jgi:hypothetical protein
MNKGKALELINEYLAKQEPKKEELSTEKVELGLVQDIKRFNDIIKDEFKRIEKEGAILGKALAEAERQRRKFLDIVMFSRRTKQQAEGYIQNFKKAASDLGIDSETADIKEMRKLIIEIDEYIKFANQIDRVPQI